MGTKKKLLPLLPETLHSVSITHQFLCLPVSVRVRVWLWVCRILLAMKTRQLWPKMKSSIAFAKLKEKETNKKKHEIYSRIELLPNCKNAAGQTHNRKNFFLAWPNEGEWARIIFLPKKWKLR